MKVSSFQILASKIYSGVILSRVKGYDPVLPTDTQSMGGFYCGYYTIVLSDKNHFPDF